MSEATRPTIDVSYRVAALVSSREPSVRLT
jgi:hypothetical protein